VTSPPVAPPRGVFGGSNSVVRTTRRAIGGSNSIVAAIPCVIEGSDSSRSDAAVDACECNSRCIGVMDRIRASVRKSSRREALVERVPERALRQDACAQRGGPLKEVVDDGLASLSPQLEVFSGPHDLDGGCFMFDTEERAELADVRCRHHRPRWCGLTATRSLARPAPASRLMMRRLSARFATAGQHGLNPRRFERCAEAPAFGVSELSASGTRSKRAAAAAAQGRCAAA
jgi:hypothetical protein